MTKLIDRLRDQLGGFGLVSLALLALGMGFLHFALRPLEVRHGELEKRIAELARDAKGLDGSVKASTPAAKLAAFYQYFDRPEEPVESLAALYGIARAAGVDLRSAEYRFAQSDGRIERYQVVMPLTGSYAQIRTFLESALGEIPVLSLDQASFRRTRVNQTQVEAEIVLTLHWLKR